MSMKDKNEPVRVATPPPTPTTSSSTRSVPGSNPTRTSTRSLADDSEIALLRVLATPQRFLSFSHICEDNQSIFGAKRSDLRRRVQNRRNFLKGRESNEFIRILKARALHDLAEDYRLQLIQEDKDSSEENEDSSTKEKKPSESNMARRKLLPGRLCKYIVCWFQFCSLDGHSPPPTTTAASSSPSAQSAEFRLNLQQPHCNQGGIYPVLSNEVKVGDELVSKMTLYLPFCDLRDYNGGRFRAVLLRDYTGVEVTMPTVPRFLYENADTVQSSEANGDERTKEAHQVQAVSLLGDEVGQVKKVIYRFSGESMTCNNKTFNDEATGAFNLVPKPRVLNAVTGKRADGTEIKQLFPYVFWEMAIDGETRRLANKKYTNHVDDIEKAMIANKKYTSNADDIEKAMTSMIV
jgi:hypothetical protein